MYRLKVFLAVAFLLQLTPRIAYPQASTAQINGTVRDTSGALLVGARLTLTNTATGTNVNTTSNEAGLYLLPGVVPGPYRIEAESPGMEKYQVSLVVQLAQTLTVDLLLKPGTATTTVEVKDVTPMVNMTNSTASTIVESKQIEQRAWFGRQIAYVTNYVPGFLYNNFNVANGLRYGNPIDWTLDGAPLIPRAYPGVMIRMPGVDSVQEVNLQTSNVDAKASTPIQFIISTKNGTNQFHGSLFETIQNSGIYFARSRNLGNVTPPYSNRNEFGASAGGPVYIPKLYNGKNKTFWFFAWESRRQLTQSYSGLSVPTAAMRAGDFSGLVNANGMFTTIYDPLTTVHDPATGAYTRQPSNYGGTLNAIDPSRVSRLWTYLMKITPMPTLPNVNPLISANWWGNVPSSWDDDSYTVRFDHQFSDRDRFYARYQKVDQTLISLFSGTIPTLDNSANVSGTYYPGQTLATSYVHIFSPTMFSELLVSGMRSVNERRPTTSIPGGYDKMLGLPNPFNQQQFPYLDPIGMGGGYYTVSPNADRETFYQVDENITKVYGKHQFLAGGRLRRMYVNYWQSPGMTAGRVYPISTWTALGNPAASAASPAAMPYTGSSIASAYLGADGYMATSPFPYLYSRQNQHALYFQDNWKVTPRLTLNLGLRWEAWPVLREKYNNVFGFDPKAGAIVLTQPVQSYAKLDLGMLGAVSALQGMGVPFETSQQAGLPQSLQYGNWKDFSPRVGFAYRVTGGSRPLVFRAGFSISYYPIQASTALQDAIAGIPMVSSYYWYPDTAGYYPDGMPGYSLRTAPPYTAGVNTTHVLDNLSAGGFTSGNLTVQWLEPHQPDSRVADGNITLEKEILPKTVLRASWVANHNDNVDSFFNSNSQMPQYVWAATQGTPYPSSAGGPRPFSSVLGDLKAIGRRAYSNYSSIRVELQRRYSNGISYQAYYVANNSYVLGNAYSGQTSLTLYPASHYLPSQVSGWSQDELNRQIAYSRNTTFPKHQLSWNWVASIPVGRGKRFFGNMRPWLDAVAGGWQLSGIGNWQTTWWSLQSGQFPTGTPLKTYGHSVKVQDCRGGQCLSAYLYSNSGWINPAQVNQTNAAGQCIGICGIPSGYQSFSAPLVTDPTSKYFGTNTVTIPLSNGTNWVGAWGGISPLNNQYFETPGIWQLQASLFKEIPVRERVRLRFQWDVANPTNSPEEPNGPNGNGLIYTYTNGQGARSMEFSLRLLW